MLKDMEKQEASGPFSKGILLFLLLGRAKVGKLPAPAGVTLMKRIKQQRRWDK